MELERSGKQRILWPDSDLLARLSALTKRAVITEFEQELIGLLVKQNIRMKEMLTEIKAFGYHNSGKGYSCAKMADGIGRHPHGAPLEKGRES